MRLPCVAAVDHGEHRHRDVDQAMIGDGDAVRIAAQITQNPLRAGKGLLAVDHPRELPRSRPGRRNVAKTIVVAARVSSAAIIWPAWARRSACNYMTFR
jgi:hypothetical protein